MTADAVVEHSGHGLLVRRRAETDRGLRALPGGFFGQDETILDACLRELREETRRKLATPVLKGSIRRSTCSTIPDPASAAAPSSTASTSSRRLARCPRCAAATLPEARGAPVSEALETGPNLFEDHLHILAFFLGRG